MRHLVLVLVAACGFSQPRDRCDGPCALYAIDQPIAMGGDVLTLDGTFEDGALVDFPGGMRIPLDYRGAHRANVHVPDTATAGELALSMPDGYTDSVPFRHVSFYTALLPFVHEWEQPDVGRHNMLPSTKLSGATTLVAGEHLYLIGGIESAGAVQTVRHAYAGIDGNIDDFLHPAQPLAVARGKHTSIVIGHYVYVIGGAGVGGELDSIERAEIDHDGNLGPFGLVQDTKLNAARSGHATVVIGDYVYVLGGRVGNNDLDSIERARIGEQGALGPFELINEIKLPMALSGLAVAVTGSYLYVVGGSHSGIPTDAVFRLEISPDGYLGTFEPAGRLQTARAGHSMLLLRNGLYVIGGVAEGGELDSIEVATVLDNSNMPVTTLEFAVTGTKLAEPRQGAALAVVGNNVYLLGGTYFSLAMSTTVGVQWIERATIVDAGMMDQFVAVTDTHLVQARSSACAVVVGKWLYIIGGSNGGMALKSVERAPVAPDGTVGAFETTQLELQAARYGASAFVIAGYVFVSGGTDGSSKGRSIEFAPILDDGSLGSFQPASQALVLERAFHSTILTGQGNNIGIWVVGGEGNSGPVGYPDFSFYQGPTLYPFRADFQEQPTARRGLATVVLDRNAYSIGGINAALPQDIARNVLDAPSGDQLVQWTNFGNLTSGRELHGLAVAGPTLYVIGGVSGAALPGIESAKVTSGGNLGPLQPANLNLRTPRFGQSTVTLGNYIYVIGGATSPSAPLDSLERTLIK